MRHQVSKALTISLLCLTVMTAASAADEKDAARTSLSAESADQRSRHSLVSGLANSLLGYRYTYSNKSRFQPFVTLGVLLSLNVGFEYTPRNASRHSFEYHAGSHFFGEAIGFGAKWMWHPKGVHSKGFTLGLGAIHIPKQENCFIYCNRSGRINTADVSLNWKF